MMGICSRCRTKMASEEADKHKCIPYFDIEDKIEKVIFYIKEEILQQELQPVFEFLADSKFRWMKVRLGNAMTGLDSELNRIEDVLKKDALPDIELFEKEK